MFPQGVDPEVLKRVQRGENDCEIELIIGQPRISPTPGKKTICLAAWESTQLPPECIGILNSCDLVIAPSNFCAQVYSSCGVIKPIRVVPLGVDDDFFFYRHRQNQGHFSFACAGNLRNGAKRKGIQRIIDHFRSAFPNEKDVLLNVKLGQGQSVDTRGDGRICVVASHLDESSLAFHFSQTDCFIHYGVGAYELVPLEAMSLGRPVIAPRWGGHADYFNSENGIVVSHHLVPAGDSWRGLGHWAEVDEDAAIAAMRWAYTHRSDLPEIGWMAHRSVRHLTWENHTAKIVDVIKSISAMGMKSPTVRTPSKTKSLDDLRWEAWLRGEDDYPTWAEQCAKNKWQHGLFEFKDGESGYTRFNAGACMIGRQMLLFPRRSILDSRGNRGSSRIENWLVDGSMRPVAGKQIDLLDDMDQEDARAVCVNGNVFISYTQLSRRGIPVQCFAPLTPDGASASTIYVPSFGGNGDGRTWQKNFLYWFDDGAWRFVYDSSHCVVELSDVGGRLDVFRAFNSKFDWSKWKWGTPRGGTPPIRVGDEMWTVFHSSVPWMHGRKRYVAGAYAFSPHPPFGIIRATPEPLLIGRWNSPESIIPHGNIFPMSMIHEGGNLLITMGVNDDACAYFRISVDELSRRME